MLINKFKYGIAVIAVWCIGLHLHGQDLLVAPAQITIGDLSDDRQQYAFATDDAIYLADVNAMRVVDSFTYRNHEHMLVSQLEISPNGNAIIYRALRPKNGATILSELTEYPNDSLYIYNFTDRQTRAVAGNVYLNFGRGTNRYVVGYNVYSPYQGQFFPIKGGALTSYPDEITVPSSGTIRQLLLSPDNQRLAVVYFDSLAANYPSVNYRLELRSFPQLDSLTSVTFTLPRVTDVRFSAQGDYIAVVAAATRFRTCDQLLVFSCPELVQLDKWPAAVNVDGLIEQGTVWRIDEGDIVNESQTDGQRLYHIWPGITRFASIDGFARLNQDELLIFGSSHPALGHTRNGVQRFSMRNNAVYGQTVAFDPVDTLFQPQQMQVQDNMLAVDRMDVGVVKKHFLVQKGTLLQIWSAQDRLKLYDLPVENEAMAFMGADETTALILESNEDVGYANFTVGRLDLATGLRTKHRFADPPADFFDFSNSCNCVPISGASAQWICNDWGSKLWKVDGDSLTISAIRNLERADFDFTRVKNLHHLPGSNLVVFNLAMYNNIPNKVATTDEIYSALYVYDNARDTLLQFDQLQGLAKFYPWSARQIAFVQGGQITIADLTATDTPTQALMSLEGGELADVKTDGDRTCAIVGQPGESFDLAHVFDHGTGRLVTSQEIPHSSHVFIRGDALHYSDGRALHTFSIRDTTTIHWKTKHSLFTQPERLSYDGNQRILFGGELLVDLKTLDVEHRLPSYTYPALINGADDGQVLLIDSDPYADDPHFRFVVAKPGELETPIWASEVINVNEGMFGSPNQLRLSPDGRFALAFSDQFSQESTRRVYYVLDLVNRQVRKERAPAALLTATFAADGACYELLMASTGTSSYLALQDSTLAMDKVFIYDTATGERIRGSREALVTRVYGQQFPIINYDMVLLHDFTQGQPTHHTYYARESLATARWYPDLQLVVAGSNSGNIFIWNRDNQSPQKKIHIGSEDVLRIDRMANKLFVLMKNSEIKVVDLEHMVFNATLSITQDTTEQKSIAWFTPDGYFKASKEQMREYHFVKGFETFPLSSYELFLNRPDVVMERVGFSDRPTITLYHEAYQRRLKRYGVSSLDDFLALERPDVTIVNVGQLPASVTNRELSLQLRVRSDLAAIKTVTVYVNGVPASIHEVPSDTALTANVVLNTGQNNISVVAQGHNGIESDPVGISVLNRQPATPAQIHYLGIGVSDYQDSTMNLRYAAKDIRAMVDYLGMRYEGRFHIVDTLMNENAVRPRIQDVRQKLMATDVDDVVILSLSGHGLVDGENRFYFGTHDIDFSEPQGRGLSYADIQHLLDGIPARRKLVLLDACHSGEIDEDIQTVTDTASVEQIAQDVVAVQIRGSKAVGLKKKAKNNSFEVMRTVFYDFDRGNGTFVISAAGGREYAYEGEDWSNGVFTYSVIQAFQDLGYDTYRGRIPIKLSDLKNEVYRRVSQLTKGRQKPTARSENIEWDWSF